MGNFIFRETDIVTALLKNTQTELRQDRQQMIKNIRLRIFVGVPLHRPGETVDFKRNTCCTRRQLTDEKCHILIDQWTRIQSAEVNQYNHS